MDRRERGWRGWAMQAGEKRVEGQGGWVRREGVGGAWHGRVVEGEGKGEGEPRSEGQREEEIPGFFYINFFLNIIVTSFIEKDFLQKFFFINILLRNQKKIKKFNQTPIIKVKN